MSQIASFYVLPATRFDDLVVAATPRVVTIEKHRFLFRTRSEQLVDEYWDFLRTVAREPEPCPYPGGMFCDIDLLLEPRGWMLFDVARRDLTDRLSAARDGVRQFYRRSQPAPAWPPVPIRSGIPVFDHGTAVAAVAKVDEAGVTELEIRRHVEGDHRYSPADHEPAVATILAAFELAKRWLRAVGQADVGVLNVG